MSEMSISPGSAYRNPLRRFFVLAFGFWLGPSRKTAWLLSLGFLASLIASVLVAVGFNQWNKFFFDALQLGDRAALAWSGAFILALAVCTAITSTAGMQTRMRLQLGWRKWLTEALIVRWIRNRPVEHIEMMRAVDNPEARIADDGRIAVELFVDVAGGHYQYGPDLSVAGSGALVCRGRYYARRRHDPGLFRNCGAHLFVRHVPGHVQARLAAGPAGRGKSSAGRGLPIRPHADA